MSKTVKVVLAVLLVLVLGVGIYFLVTAGIRDSMERSASEFTAYVEDDRVSTTGNAGKIEDDKQIVKVHVDGYTVYGYTSVEARNYTYWTTFPSLYDSDALTNILENWVQNYGLKEYSFANPNAGLSPSSL